MAILLAFLLGLSLGSQPATVGQGHHAVHVFDDGTIGGGDGG